MSVEVKEIVTKQCTHYCDVCGTIQRATVANFVGKTFALTTVLPIPRIGTVITHAAIVTRVGISETRSAKNTIS